MLFRYKVRVINSNGDITEYYYYERNQAEVRLDYEIQRNNNHNICELSKIGINGIKIII